MIKSTKKMIMGKMKELIFLMEESLEGGYEARTLEASIHAEAESLKELKEAIKDAVKCHFDEKEIPRIIRLRFVKEEVMTI
ncbi:MAG: 2-oxoisovalerate dehydrogenase [Promethearchaeota archaeon]